MNVVGEVLCMTIWRDVPGYEGHYQASNDGRVRSCDKLVRTKNNAFALKRGKELKQTLNKKDYL
jgi:hypothetical protein